MIIDNGSSRDKILIEPRDQMLILGHSESLVCGLQFNLLRGTGSSMRYVIIY
jgi:hypothetical protein